MPFCTGAGSPSGDHCCWVNGERCPFLVEHQDGRRFACGLRVELGSWEAVHADPRYLTVVKPVWEQVGIPDCGTWFPPPGICCDAPREE